MTKLAVIDPGLAFGGLSRAFETAAWRQVSAAQNPILPGEPEHAVFERGDERAHYTFNPVCRLRVVELPAEPDTATREALPFVDAADVASWLESQDERTLLRGVLAARLLPDAGYASRLQALRSHPRAVIAQAAERALEALPGDARASALAAAQMVKASVQPLLEALMHDTDGSVAATLAPRPEDYARAFVPEAVERARKAYEALWATPPRAPRAMSGSRIETYVAPAGMLASDNELSRHFPGGYRAIAHLLDPHRVWVRWKVIQPGETAGTAYDGLVWLDDRWAWFPKPFRALGG